MSSDSESGAEVDEGMEQTLLLWTEEQRRMSLLQVTLPDPDPSSMFPSFPAHLRVGGLDLTEPTDHEKPSIASYVVTNILGEELYSEHSPVIITAPYVPSFLSFREAPTLIPLISRQRCMRPEVTPHYLICDGNGTLHPRSFGLACHLSVLLDDPIPTIGVSKNLHVFEGLIDAVGQPVTAKSVKAAFRDGSPLIKPLENARYMLLYYNSRVIGAAFSSSYVNPIFVSPGHNVSLLLSLHLVSKLSFHRVVEPVRLADLGGRAVIRNTPSAST